MGLPGTCGQVETGNLMVQNTYTCTSDIISVLLCKASEFHSTHFASLWPSNSIITEIQILSRIVIERNVFLCNITIQFIASFKVMAHWFKKNVHNIQATFVCNGCFYFFSFSLDSRG